MKQTYHIFHSVDDESIFTETEKQDRKYAGDVEAESLEEALTLTQHLDDVETDWGERSTSVGDLIQDHDGFYLVCSEGFRLICKNSDEGAE